MSQATQKRFEMFSRSIERWGAVAVLIAIVAPAVADSVSSLSQLPIL